MLCDRRRRPAKAELKLKDQFREDVDIVAARFLCNPVDKNGEGIPNEKAHLVCFEIKVDKPDDTTYAVETVNQLGKNRYFVRDRNSSAYRHSRNGRSSVGAGLTSAAEKQGPRCGGEPLASPHASWAERRYPRSGRCIQVMSRPAGMTQRSPAIA